SLGRFTGNTSWAPGPLDFPFERHALAFRDAAAHFLTEAFDVRACRIAGVYQEVRVLLAHLGSTHPEAAATRRIDQPPGLVAGRVLEGRAAGLAPQRLGLLAGMRDAVHLRADLCRVARRAAEPRRD